MYLYITWEDYCYTAPLTTPAAELDLVGAPKSSQARVINASSFQGVSEIV